MLRIKEFNFPKDISILKSEKYGQNWPVVYLIHNHKEIYIGETYNLHSRMKQHYDNPEKQLFNKLQLISDSDFNKSATLDIESSLIKYMSADGKFKVTNKTGGLVNSDYYERINYQYKIGDIWNKLRKISLANKDLIEIENSDIFKFSPYKALSEDQLDVTKTIRDDIVKKNKNQEQGIYFINGLPGSGKTVLATFLTKYLLQDEELKTNKIGLIVSMTSLRNTLKKAFKHVDGLKSSMVIGPMDLNPNEYDILLVDEAHRLRQRKNITNYRSMDLQNEKFGLSNQGTELDWIKLAAKHIILFYDENQSIRPSDVNGADFNDLKPTYNFTLNSQFRVKAGMDFIYYIRNIFNGHQKERKSFDRYESSIINDFDEFTKTIYTKESEHGLSLIVSGYAFEWVSKKDKSKYDIIIDDIHLKWNTVSQNFIHSPNAAKEVGCIHTVQGYELNYVGVIIGSEIDYDFKANEIVIYRDKYYDRNGKSNTTYQQLLKYIKNIYITLATRGIYGVHFYVMNDNMRKYLAQYFTIANDE
ncbi:hypothetical protein BK011_08980 [Tenericutes bacterium MZ-XQ]|nr:hypothetical protein BK011_08980 [Tenericutes bacterium MZ-XQ]